MFMLGVWGDEFGNVVYVGLGFSLSNNIIMISLRVV